MDVLFITYYEIVGSGLFLDAGCWMLDAGCLFVTFASCKESLPKFSFLIPHS